MSRLSRHLFFVLFCISIAACDNSEIRDLREQLRLQEEQFQEQLRQQEQFQEQLLQHEEEIERLKTLVASANNSISALHTSVLQMEAGGYVTSVIPREQNGTVTGYWLTFGSGDTIFLSTGEESTPRISVRAYNGGDYYWTLDDEYLLDSDGEMVPVEEGATPPLLQAEDGHWTISLDNAGTWTPLESASQVTSLFKAIDTSNKNYVTITLADGTVLQLTTWSAHVTLQNLVNKLNSNLAALSRIVYALDDRDYLQSLTPFYENSIQVGWYLNFSNSGTIAVYSLGSQDDGVDLHQAMNQSGAGDGDCIVDIDASGTESVKLIMSDGSSIMVPRYQTASIRVDVPIWGDYDTIIEGQPASVYFILIGLDETVSCFYHLNGTNLENATFTAFSDGNFVVSVNRSSPSEGTINITCVREFEEGYITVLLNDAAGRSTTQTIKAIFKTSETPNNGDPFQLSDGRNFTVPASGGIINTLIPKGWSTMGYISFSSLEWFHTQKIWDNTNYQLAVFTIDENNHKEDRFVTVEMKRTDGTFIASFRVKQEGNPNAEPHPYWEVEHITFSSEGGEYSFKVKVRPEDRWCHFTHSELFNLTIDDPREDEYATVTISVDPNPDGFIEQGVLVDVGYANGIIRVEQLRQ